MSVIWPYDFYAILFFLVNSFSSDSYNICNLIVPAVSVKLSSVRGYALRMREKKRWKLSLGHLCNMFWCTMDDYSSNKLGHHPQDVTVQLNRTIERIWETFACDWSGLWSLPLFPTTDSLSESINPPRARSSRPVMWSGLYGTTVNWLTLLRHPCQKTGEANKS